jgi:hypothetical protein
MTALRSIWRTLTAALLTAAYWLAVQGTALAAAKKPEPEEQSTGSGGAGWTISYALLILFVALGVFVVLKPSRRRDRANPEQYGE